MLAKEVQELPSSRESSPVDGVESQARVGTLRRRVKTAYETAHANPSDGKWGLLTYILKTGVTRGHYRYITTRADGMMAEPGAEGWVNVRSEEEWKEWEKRRAVEEKLKSVEMWQKSVFILQDDDIINLSDKPEGAKAVVSRDTGKAKAMATEQLAKRQPSPKPKSTAADPLTDRTPLGFAVVKRANQTTVGKPPYVGQGSSKPPPPPAPTNSAPKLDSQPKLTKGDVVRDSSPPIKLPSRNARNIADISETLATSTPHVKPNYERKKPDMIPSAPPSPISSPVAAARVSPKVSKVCRRLPSMDTYPAIPTTPAHRPVESLKRPLSPTSPERSLKKAKTMPEPSSSTSATNANLPKFLQPQEKLLPVREQPENQPVTLKRSTLPTLTALLATAKKTKAKTKSRSKEPRTPSTGTSSDKDEERALEQAAAAQMQNERTPLPSPPKEKAALRFPSLASVSHADTLPLFDNENPYMLEPDPYGISSGEISLGLGLSDSNLNHSHDYASPTKSLSSLAGSDSESEDELEAESVHLDLDFSKNPETFDPMFASTQMQYGRQQDEVLGSSSVFREEAASSRPMSQSQSVQSVKGGYAVGGFGAWVGYNSQFDVDKQVDEVDKLLERDVDYDGWLRDPSLEPNELESQ
ncbi:hypothetical protein BDQ12DRAFT_668552 [Crucibulum laeve]|uniref:Uncharacterized protein n=1 Tax=Crucibulum laeve TaxID=68775 RepID=A0A5C3M319_9AGAR|nr:hypothetical protein BDQ12DRAFT_668552 [Crucibulum laeve]